MKQKVVTFGEIMLRLAPEGYYRFVQADTFGATYGGGEANVAVSLANYGFDAKYVTRLPNHEIGQCAINSLRKYGVDTSYIARGGDRIGIYTPYPEKAMYHLSKQGVKFVEESITRNKKTNRINFVYLDLEIAGFGIHLINPDLKMEI